MMDRLVDGGGSHEHGGTTVAVSAEGDTIGARVGDDLKTGVCIGPAEAIAVRFRGGFASEPVSV